jgi:hypothetical protein
MQIRTLFSSSGIGIDTFKLSREQHASRYAPSLGKYLFNYFSYFIFLNSDGFKKRFLDSIGQSNSQIFTEDLRNMIMSANNDQEIDAVIQALKRYLFEKISLKNFGKYLYFCFRYSTNKVKFTDYHFGSPIMRLLYIQNKTDLALQLYMDEVKIRKIIIFIFNI